MLESRARVTFANLVRLKQRNGPTGEIKTVFKKSLMTFENGYEPKGGPITDEDCD